jgi:uncharacterized heparinase superfamily protein
MFYKWSLLFNSIRYLKIIQISNRIKRKFIKPNINSYFAPKLGDITNNFYPVVQCSQKMYGHDRFKFLNKEFNIRTIEDWNSPEQDKLWLYNLHYFDDLNAVGSMQRNSWHCSLVQRWINENPIGVGNGWESYPLSLRIVNWIKWSLLNDNLKKEWLDSLAVQVRFLSQKLEYHLLANHLFANAKALIFAGLYFQDSESDKWYQSGIKILNKELHEQILADGGNFELSPMYHAIFLEDLLDLINIHQVYQKKIPDSIVPKVLQMLKWLQAMCHPDGEIAFFNDSTLSVAPTLNNLLDYTKRLKVVYSGGHRDKLTHLKESGYIRVSIADLDFIADVAKIGPDYMPGHGHADVLSFELCLFGKRVIVNSGISTYESGNERSMQRGTLTHSTITVDNNNSSEVWAGFRVAKRAKVFNINKSKKGGNIEFSACHDGYKRFGEKIIHCREWAVSERLLEVMDKVTGGGKHEITSVLPLHPEVLVDSVKNNSVELKIKNKKVKINFKGDGFLQVKRSYYHPGFGLSIESNQLVYTYNNKLPFKGKMEISW